MELTKLPQNRENHNSVLLTTIGSALVHKAYSRQGIGRVEKIIKTDATPEVVLYSITIKY